MFNNFAYVDVTREERLFCAMFAHALLMSPLARQRLNAMARERWAVDLNPDTLEVYVEPATLRDYWHNLGNAMKYTEDTAERRRAVIEAILALNDKPLTTLDAHDFFWTTSAHLKIWSPGRWSEDALDAADLGVLRTVKKAFNAKPDLLLVSGQAAILIEAKVESGEGKKSATDERQLQIQQNIIDWLKVLHPAFGRTSFVHVLLDVSGRGAKDLDVVGLSWHDACEVVDTPELDAFSQRCLTQLRRYEQGMAATSDVGRPSTVLATA